MPLDAEELSQRLKKLSNSLQGFPKNPTVDEVHALRTRARRVESVLEALEMDSAGNEKSFWLTSSRCAAVRQSLRQVLLCSGSSCIVGLLASPWFDGTAMRK